MSTNNYIDQAIQHKRKQEILDYINELERNIEQTEEGAVYPDGSLAVVCTSAAKLVASRFQGVVRGYNAESNKQAGTNKYADGHDFAIVELFLVDVWGAYTQSYLKSPILHLHEDRDIIYELYGPTPLWEKI